MYDHTAIWGRYAEVEKAAENSLLIYFLDLSLALALCQGQAKMLLFHDAW